jgi:hypothetical protein
MSNSIQLNTVLSDLDFLKTLNSTFQLVYKKNSSYIQFHSLSDSTLIYTIYEPKCDPSPFDAMFSIDANRLIETIKMHQSTSYIGVKFDTCLDRYFLCIYDTPAFSTTYNIELSPANIESILDVERIDQTIPQFFKCIEFDSVQRFCTLIGLCFEDPILYTHVKSSNDPTELTLMAYDSSNTLLTSIVTCNVNSKGLSESDLLFDFKLLKPFLTSHAKIPCRFIWTHGRPVEFEFGPSMVSFVAPCEHQIPPPTTSTTSKKRKTK